MQHIRWHRLLAWGVLAAPSPGLAQGPQPKIREVVTMPGVAIEGAVRLPNGIVFYRGSDSLFAYDPVTKRSTLIAGFDGGLSVSPGGDRIAFTFYSPDKVDYIWSIPIDPKTGAAAGPAQRVSLSAGDSPTLSPDGKLIAFSMYNTHDLAVVSSTGGPERVLARFAKGIEFTSWSPDGKWILVDVGLRDSILRVPAAGGPPEKLISYAGIGEGVLNGQLALFRPDFSARVEGRIAYAATTSGKTGAFRIPPGGNWAGDYLGVPSQPKLFTRTTRPTTAYLLNLADGTLHDLLPGTPNSLSPVWSPDGRRIALQISATGRDEIVVMNADGSEPRRYPVHAKPMSLRWSPTGQMLAYFAADAPTLAVLDLATGTTRRIASAPNTPDDYIWRPDGNSIVLVKHPALTEYLHGEVYEVRLDGAERKLRDLGVEFPDFGTGGFISDQLLAAGTQTAAVQSAALIPTASGALRKLPGGAHHAWPGVSRDGKWLLWLSRNANRRFTSVELMTTTGDSLRTVSLPFEAMPGMKHPPFLPDGQHVILVGRVPGDTVSKIFLVPLDGSAPRVLATLPLPAGHATQPYDGRLDLSPDGKRLVFTTEGAPTSTIYEIDMSPILRAVGKP